MAGRKQKALSFQKEIFVYKDKWGEGEDEVSDIVANSVKEAASLNETIEVGVYQLVRVVKVTGEFTVKVEE